METRQEIVVFLSEYDLQVSEIEKMYVLLEDKLKLLEGDNINMESVESTGYWLHNLYCACEDLFKLIAGFWENTVKSNGDFHINLLKRMLMEIEGIRPAVLSNESYGIMNELRGFRHVFRHAYSYGIDEKRIKLLLCRMLNSKAVFLEELNRFRNAIHELIV